MAMASARVRVRLRLRTARRRLRNGRPGRCTRAPAPPSREATLATTSPLLIRDEADREAYRRVENHVRLTRYGGDCYAYCALAAGFIDIVIETNLKPHDIVALVPIIEGAGGMVTTWDGDNAAKGGRIIAAGDRAVYDEARRLLLEG